MDLQVLVAACLLSIVLWLARTRSRRRSLPPGPSADPLIGHLRIVPSERVPDESSEKLQELDDNPDAEDLEDIKDIGATIFSEGATTSYVVLLWFYLAMILHPECQQRAYKEIVAVVGESALPDLNDRESLPYVECIVQEVHRWNVVGPFGMPHRAINDDVYNGMLVPKSAMVIPNVRICLGRHYADLAVWHAIVCTLTTLEIIPKTDEMGNPKLPEVTYTGETV
ncbi:hypothetical protein PQX77_008848, partial [Marasmius sp. AFHP31]